MLFWPIINHSVSQFKSYGHETFYYESSFVIIGCFYELLIEIWKYILISPELFWNILSEVVSL